MSGSLLSLLLVLLLAFAAPAARAQSQPPGEAEPLDRALAALKAGGPEFYLHPLSEGWQWQATESEAPYHAMTFLPEGQPLRDWSDALVLGIRRGGATAPEELLGWAERHFATACRDLRRSGLEQGATAEGWSEAWRLYVCRERLDEERGEVRLLRAVQGERAGYLLARVWRTPAFAEQLPIHQGDVQIARGLLAEGGPCLMDGLRSACPYYSSIGLGSIEEARPYGVFSVRGR